MADFKEYMENNANKRINGVDEKMSTMQGTINRIDQVVKGNSDRIEKNEAQISEIRAEVEKLKKTPARHFPPLPPPGSLVVQSTLGKHRRSERGRKRWSSAEPGGPSGCGQSRE